MMDVFLQKSFYTLCLFLGFCVWNTYAQDSLQAKAPTEYTYRSLPDTNLQVYVFLPRNPAQSQAAIVLFHGGGWSMGQASWAFSRARHFAARGLVAVAVQYRLSDQKAITPFEAMSDARASIRWVRLNAVKLGVHPKRIVAFGWSAGGHLAASTAIFLDSTAGSVSHVPDALILLSPALHLETDRWVQQLLGRRANSSSISPASHIRKGLPPTLILQGSDDTVTPLVGAELFCDRMKRAGNRCDLQIYEGVGHLFTPKSVRDDGWPQPDPGVQAMALQKADEFLISLGFLK